jgi:hypothetical protein
MTYQFYSQQLQSVMVNGQQKIKKNTVTVKNGKGRKAVTIQENGKSHTSVKPLSTADIQKIQKNQFIPGLFKDCHDCLNRQMRSQKSQTRRAPKKRNHRSRKYD